MTQSLHATVWYLFIIWLQNLTCTCTLLVLRVCAKHNGTLHSVSLTVHEATWHMWKRCRDILVWIDHSDVLLVPEECTHPLSGTLAVHARREDVHARTHSLARTRWHKVGRIFVRRSTPCDNLMRVKSFTSLMVN